MSHSQPKKSTWKPRTGQLTFGYCRTAGEGEKLGRKLSKDSGFTHDERPKLRKGVPVHITLKWRDGLPDLRHPDVERVLLSIFQIVNGRRWLRIVHHSIQHNHLHMICEVKGGKVDVADSGKRTSLSLETTLSREVQGMKIRMARGLNRLWGRKGKVFADRFHREDLPSPTQVRCAIVYVLQNIFRHSQRVRKWGLWNPDVFSSGRWFAGWRERRLGVEATTLVDAPVCEPETWLLSVGWKRLGLISIKERPANT